MDFVEGTSYLQSLGTSQPYVRLLELARETANAELAADAAKVGVSEAAREVSEAVDMLSAEAEGKNAEERKASLAKLQQGERIVALRQSHTQAQYSLFELQRDAAVLRHEERALLAFLALRTAQINFLAGTTK